jgi:hypothetical protein
MLALEELCGMEDVVADPGTVIAIEPHVRGRYRQRPRRDEVDEQCARCGDDGETKGG